MLVLEPTRVRRYAGWSAYVSAGLSIISGVSLLLFYALEAPRAVATGGASPHTLGTVNDVTGLVGMACQLPLTVALHQFAPARRQWLSWVALALGVAGILMLVIAQALLVAQVISFAVNVPFVMAALVLIGTWLILANHLGRRGGALPPRLTWLGELTGAAFVLLGGVVLLLVTVGSGNPLAAANVGATFAQQSPVLFGAVIVLAFLVFLVLAFGELIWLIWLGRRLLTAPAGAPEQRDRLPAHAGTTR
jgi:hypothetical protein